MGLTVILFLIFFLVVLGLAHYSGKEMAREEEYVRMSKKPYVCHECRRLSHDTIRTYNSTREGNEHGVR